MIDYAKIMVKAGDGGAGAGSFMHIKGKRLGKADGGDGGRGGNVYLVATRDLNTLEPFRFVKEYRAKSGQHGSSQRRKGADGEDLVVKVPVGTLVKVDADPVNQTLDLAEEGQKILVARGGEDGRGNAHLRDEFGRRPKSGEVGEAGEEVHLTLELKLIADVGLIGLPNAGKSTLLKALTKATPKIADYPFTTLEPNLGVLQVGGTVGRWDSRKRSKTPTDPQTHKPTNLILADIPGLIEGASEGRGLGHLFLRHIERTKMLVHLIDISTASDLWQTYQTVRHELKNYSKDLAKKKEIVVLNKVDLVSSEKAIQLVKVFKAHKKQAITISAKNSERLNYLINSLTKFLGERIFIP